MTGNGAEFGTPSRFQIRLEWRSDPEPVERRPIDHGWSMGMLALTVANRNLMAHQVRDDGQDSLCWFLGPLFHWLADNWISLLHEEHFAWRERSADAAAAACEQAMASPAEEESLDAVQQWYFRHGISSAAVGGVFPDIFLRRFSDDIELSWTGASPPFAPTGFAFTSDPGRAYLPLEDVALPLWEMLCWVKDHPPELETDAFVTDFGKLASKIERLSAMAPAQYQCADLPEALLNRLQDSFGELDRLDMLEPVFHDKAPIVVSRSPAMAMFGGLDVDIADSDVASLRDVLIQAADGDTPDSLQDLIKNAPLYGKPWQDGYDLADEFLDTIEERGIENAPDGHVPIAALCADLGIEVIDNQLETDTVRGVALAGEELKPIIVVNESSIYNQNEKSRRFTVAHELCHILHDQSRARKLAHISGPWASPAIEQRANAFAAWLLMPRRLLLELFCANENSLDVERLRSAADGLQVTDTALIWHLFNLGFIQEFQRDGLLADLADRSRPNRTSR